MINITIRRADETDFSSVYTLICQLVGAEYGTILQTDMKDIYVKNLSSDMKDSFVAMSNGHVIGFMSLTYDMRLSEVGKVTVIDELVVDEKQRNSGIGSALIHYAINCAIKNSCGYIEVSTNLRRIDAHKFYEKASFEKNGYRFGYSCGD